jgi:uroporphyrinogen-III synthase
VIGTLSGRRVLVTRERPGELAAMLTARGAVVVHMPLIRVIEPADDGRALRAELDRLDEYDWLVVTAAPGAERVGRDASRAPTVRLAAVGTTTASVLAESSGRRVDLVPDVQLAAALADAFNDAAPSSQRVLLALADRASNVLADALRDAGHRVTAVTAYRTVAQAPDRALIDHADAVLFASGSAVESWVAAVGPVCPAVAVAIGPTTATTAERLGLKLSGVATDHSLDGLVIELERQLADSTRLHS